ncbi:MAG: hypothetical protein QM504_13590 [Pseudomonadota bacterium]
MKKPMEGQMSFDFSVSIEEGGNDCSMDYALEVSMLVSLMLKSTDADRYHIAADMSRLSGHDISKNMLDAYASGSRDTHNMPFYLIPVLEKACHSHDLIKWFSKKRGAKVLFGRESLNAELGKMERMKLELAKNIRNMKKQMGEMD